MYVYACHCIYAWLFVCMQSEGGLPQWIHEAAADMAAGGVTAGGGATSFGASNGVGGGSGTACNVAIDMTSGGLLDHVRSLLLLRPLSLHDVWLRKVQDAWGWEMRQGFVRKARAKACAWEMHECRHENLCASPSNHTHISTMHPDPSHQLTPGCMGQFCHPSPCRQSIW